MVASIQGWFQEELTALKSPQCFLWGGWVALISKTLSKTESRPFHNVKCIDVAGYIKYGRLVAENHLKMNKDACYVLTDYSNVCKRCALTIKVFC